MPYIEKENLYDTLDLNGPWDVEGSANYQSVRILIDIFRCPSSGAPLTGDNSVSEGTVPCTYLACCSGVVERESGTIHPKAGDDNLDGTFFRNSRINLSEISDGASHTITVAETLFDDELTAEDYEGDSQAVDHWYIGSSDDLVGKNASEALGSTGVPINGF